MSSPQVPIKLIEVIADPRPIREQLSRVLREARLLRSLLKLAERMDRGRGGKGVDHAR